MRIKRVRYWDGTRMIWRERITCAECGGWDAGAVGFIHHAAWCSEVTANPFLSARRDLRGNSPHA